MSQKELLAFRPGSRLLRTGASHKFLAAYHLPTSAAARNDEGLSRRHHNGQMIHTIANPVKFFFWYNNQAGQSRATTANTDSVLWDIT